MVALASSASTTAAIKIVLIGVTVGLFLLWYIISTIRRFQNRTRQLSHADTLFAPYNGRSESFMIRGRKYVWQLNGRHFEAIVVPPRRSGQARLQIELITPSQRNFAISSGVQMPAFLRPAFKWEEYSLTGALQGLRGGGDKGALDSLANTAETAQIVHDLMGAKTEGNAVLVVLEKGRLSLRLLGTDIERITSQQVQQWVGHLLQIASMVE